MQRRTNGYAFDYGSWPKRGAADIRQTLQSHPAANTGIEHPPGISNAGKQFPSPRVQRRTAWSPRRSFDSNKYLLSIPRVPVIVHFSKTSFTGCLVPRSYNQVRPRSSLGYLTPEEFRNAKGYANVESKQRFPHLHSPDGGYESKSRLNSNSSTLTYPDPGAAHKHSQDSYSAFICLLKRA